MATQAAFNLAATAHAPLPRVSIVMPVRNEERYIGRAIQSVLAQDYPRGLMEIIVADGMSTDSTRAAIEQFAGRGVDLRIMENPGQIVPTGLNMAVRQSTGEVIVRVDGHCEIAPDYIRNCVRHLQSGADCVGGWLQTVSETKTARVIALAMSSRFGVGGSSFRTGRKRTLLADTVPFPAFRRDVIEKAGPFDEELVRNQDDEYSYRLRKQGARVVLAADVHSRYYSRCSIGALSSQYFQYGYWKVRVMQKHPRQMRVRQFIPGLFVAALLATAIMLPWSGVPLLAIAVAYAAANLTASAVLAATQGIGLLPSLPVAFAALHFSYGAGFLWGLIRYSLKWTKPPAKAPFVSGTR